MNHSYTNNKGYIYVNNKKWYYRLVKNKNSKSLLDDYKLNKLENKLIICYAPEKIIINNYLKSNLTKDGTPRHLFAVFEDFIEFYNFMLDVPNNYKNFYEIILGNFNQKPHFDIDIKFNDDTFSSAVLNDLLHSILLEIPTLNLSKDLLIYSSHGANKRSYHVVIDNYCHSNNKDAEGFYHKVIQNIDEKYKVYIDSKVYSPTQQFRIVGSEKCNSNRPKVFEESFIYDDNLYTHQYSIETTEDENFNNLILLKESLVSNTNHCQLLPSYELPKKTYDYSNVSLDDDTIDLCMKKMYQKFEQLGYECPFEYLNYNGSIITLKRNAASYCPMCISHYEKYVKPFVDETSLEIRSINPHLNPHEAENPFMYTINDNIYWSCRRGKDKFDDIKDLYIGSLDRYYNYIVSKYGLKNNNKNVDFLNDSLTKNSNNSLTKNSNNSINLSTISPNLLFDANNITANLSKGLFLGLNNISTNKTNDVILEPDNIKINENKIKLQNLENRYRSKKCTSPILSKLKKIEEVSK